MIIFSLKNKKFDLYIPFICSSQNSLVKIYEETKKLNGDLNLVAPIIFLV